MCHLLVYVMVVIGLGIAFSIVDIFSEDLHYHVCALLLMWLMIININFVVEIQARGSWQRV